jgi:hypothetical protein
MTLAVFQVEVDDENSQLLDAEGVDLDIFALPTNGESVAERRWPSLLTVFDPDFPRANFYHFHSSFLVMDSETMMICRSALGRHGEFIQLTVAGVGSVYLYSPLLTLSVDAVEWSETKGRYGAYHNLTLRKEFIPTVSIFRLPRTRGVHLSTELREDERDFFYLYRKHALSGLYFKKLWDEVDGPAAGHSTQSGPN